VRTAIDTNVLSVLWLEGTHTSEMSALLGRARGEGGLVISAPVYTELMAHPKAGSGFLDIFLAKTEIAVDFAIKEEVWREAGRAFGEYAQRRRQSGDGVAKRLLADFLIGAHAYLTADRLLTLDASRYRHAFPKLRLLP